MREGVRKAPEDRARFCRASGRAEELDQGVEKRDGKTVAEMNEVTDYDKDWKAAT